MTAISVVILNYNYAEFLHAAINSALGQSHRLVEVIVVDDGSTDSSAAVLGSFGGRIRTIFHGRNQGQGAVINTGAAAAGGDVVWFLDADDTLLPNACATAAAAFEADPNLAKFHTPLAVLDRNGEWGGELLPADPARLAEGDIAKHVFRFRAHGWPPMSGNAYRADVLRRVMPIPAERYRQAADSFLNEQVAICGPIARCRHPVAAYRRHGTNQFAGQPVTLGWLRTKIDRELCSHQRLGFVAAQLGLDGFRPNPNDVQDVAFLGYRMASLRLDADQHPAIDPARPDSRLWLAIDGIRAGWRNPHLAQSDRAIRSLWFLAAAATPDVAVERLLAFYLPDGPSPPPWRAQRSRTSRNERRRKRSWISRPAR